MNKLYVYNPGLRTSSVQDNEIKIYGLVTDDLIKYGWLFSNQMPTQKFLNLITIVVDKVSPGTWQDNVQFWDSVGLGFGICNYVLDEYTQEIELGG